MSSGGGRAAKGPPTAKASAAARPSGDIRSFMKIKPQQSGAAEEGSTYDPSRQYRLTAIGEMCRGLQVEIPVSATTRCFTIGRSSSSDNHQQAGHPYKLPLKIPATENSISRKQGQAMLRVEGSRWLLKNLGTMTDIQINRRPSALGERSTCLVLKANQEAEVRVGDAVALDMWHNPCECLWRLDVSTPGLVREVSLASPASSSTTISFSSESSSGGTGKAKPTPAEQKLAGSASAGVDMSAIRADVKGAGPENNCGSRMDSNKGVTGSTPAKHPISHMHPPRPSPSPHHATNPKSPTASAVLGRSAPQATPVAAAAAHRAGLPSVGAVPASAQLSPFVDLSQSDDDEEVRVTGVKPSPAAAAQEEQMDVIEISDEDDPVQEVVPPVVQQGTTTSARAPSAPASSSVATLANGPASTPRGPVEPSREHPQSSQQQQIEEGLSRRKEEGGLWWALQSEAEPKSLGVVVRLDSEKENMRPHSRTDDAAATGAVQSALREGDYVSVAGRSDPGFNTPAGDGRITAVHHEEGGQLSYDVRYLILQGTGRRLPAWQLTLKDPTAGMPRRERKPSKRLSEAGGADETEEDGEQHGRKRSKKVAAGKGVFGTNVQSEMTTNYNLVVKEEKVSRELSAAQRRVSRVNSSNKDTAAVDDADAELSGSLGGRTRGSSRLPVSDVLLSDKEGGAGARGDEPVKCQHCGRRFPLKSDKDKAKWEDHLSEHRRMLMKQKKEERARKGQTFQEIPSSVAFCLQASLNMQDPLCLVSILREWVGMHGRVPPLSTYEHMLKALQQAQCPLRARAFHGMLMFAQRQLPPHKVPTCWRPDNPVMFMDMIEKADYTVSSSVAPRVLRSLALVLQYFSTIFEEELLSLHKAASLRRVPLSLGDSILGHLLFTPKAGSTKTGKGRMPEQKVKDLIVRAALAAANARVRPGSKIRALAMLTDGTPLPRDRADWLLLCEDLEVLGTRALTRLLASALEVYEECRELDSRDATRDASSELTYRLGQMTSSKKDQDAATITLFRQFPLRMKGFVQEYKEYETGTLKVLGLFDDIAAVEGL